MFGPFRNIEIRINNERCHVNVPCIQCELMKIRTYGTRMYVNVPLRHMCTYVIHMSSCNDDT